MAEEEASMSVLVSVAVLSAIFTYIFYRLRRMRMYQMAEKIPGPKGLPLVGNMFSFLGSPHSIYKFLYEKNAGDVTKFWIGSRLYVFLTHPADVELMLSSQERLDKSPEHNWLQPWLGHGLHIVAGDMWRAHRKMVTTTFHLNILKSFLPQFNRSSKAAVEKLQNDPQENEVDVHKVMSKATSEMLMDTVMGVDKAAPEKAEEYVEAVSKMSDILQLRHLNLLLRPQLLYSLTYKKMQDKLLETIHSITSRMYDIKNEEFIRNGYTLPGSVRNSNQVENSDGPKDGVKKDLTIMDYLLEKSQYGVMLNGEEIKNQIDTIMFFGHDTTALAGSYFLSAMAAHPEIQAKVHEEMDKVFDGSDREVTFEDTTSMKYLERCIMETLRLFPPIPVVARSLQKDLKLASCDLTIPADATVLIGAMNLHRRADQYPEPEKFNPDNFLIENAIQRHYYSYIPFSAGPRSCVGRKYAMLKLKVLLATLMRNFRAVDGKPEKDWQLEGTLFLKRSDGFKVKLQPRKSPIENFKKDLNEDVKENLKKDIKEVLKATPFSPKVAQILVH